MRTISGCRQLLRLDCCNRQRQSATWWAQSHPGCSQSCLCYQPIRRSGASWRLVLSWLWSFPGPSVQWEEVGAENTKNIILFFPFSPLVWVSTRGKRLTVSCSLHHLAPEELSKQPLVSHRDCTNTVLTLYPDKEEYEIDMKEYEIDMRGDGGGDMTPVDTDTPVITANGGKLFL